MIEFDHLTYAYPTTAQRSAGHELAEGQPPDHVGAQRRARARRGATAQLPASPPASPLPVLNDVSLHIDEGDFVLVVGPSGAGKSTLLRCINGLVPHFYGGTIGGRVRVAGRDPVALEPRRMSEVVGFVFQDPEAQAVVDVLVNEYGIARNRLTAVGMGPDDPIASNATSSGREQNRRIEFKVVE